MTLALLLQIVASLKLLFYGLLLFLLFINDLNQAIKLCKAHRSSHDANLLCLSNSIKKLNKLVNSDLKYLVHWLNTNKTLQNVEKTEMVIFKTKQKKFERDLKIRYVVKDFIPQKISNNLESKLIQILVGNVKFVIFLLETRSNRANALLFEIKKFVSPIILRSIYFAVFKLYFSYFSLVWDQNYSTDCDFTKKAV